MNMKALTEKQREMMAYAHDKGYVPSGRYGYNTAQVKRLEERGLVRPGKAGAFDQDWPLTEKGREVAAAAAEAKRAQIQNAAPVDPPNPCKTCAAPESAHDGTETHRYEPRW